MSSVTIAHNVIGSKCYTLPEAIEVANGQSPVVLELEQGLGLEALYQRDIRRFPLLSAEEEVLLAQTIEASLETLLKLFAQYPHSLKGILTDFERVEQKKLALNKLLYQLTPEALSYPFYNTA